MTGTTYSNTGLSVSTFYTYRVTAYDSAGNVSGESASASATTLAVPDTETLTIPATVMATAVFSPVNATIVAAFSAKISLPWIELLSFF